MHLGEGVLAPSVLVVTWAGAVAGMGVGLKRLKPEVVPRVAMLGAAFFVASLIQVPLGPASVHLVLNGVMGVVLGWCAFPALAAALLLQAVFFGYGGLTSLGANVLVMGGAALAARQVFVVAHGRPVSPAAVGAAGALAGGTGTVVGTALLAGLLVASGGQFKAAVVAVAVAHLPLAAVEAAVAAAGLSLLARLRPELLPSRWGEEGGTA